jgi:hypothetical protein
MVQMKNKISRTAILHADALVLPDKRLLVDRLPR